jgi:hypothetical protein
MDNTKITTNKIDDNTIEITQTITSDPIVTTQTYQLDFLISQKASIQKSKDDFDALRDAELAECEAILVSMDELGIVTKVIVDKIIK